MRIIKSTATGRVMIVVGSIGQLATAACKSNQIDDGDERI